MATSETDPIQEAYRQVAIANERVTALLALLVSKGVITPDEAGFALHSTGNDATLNQPDPPAPYSGLPTEGVV